MIFQESFNKKINLFKDLTSGCHGYAFVWVTLKSTNLAKITLLFPMETWSHGNPDKI